MLKLDSHESHHVLVVDDDGRLLLALQKALSLAGFEVATARDAGEALSVIDRGWQDVIVLDVMMPVIDGLSLCRLIRDRVRTPILMLTALDSVPDRVTGLEAGADDYLVKPFATDELTARLRALLRREQRTQPEASSVLTYQDLTLSPQLWQVTRHGDPISVTSKEFRILQLLIASPGRVFEREQILAAVWQDDDQVESNVVDVHIAGLRQKLEANGAPRLIQTVRGVGYTLRE